MGTMASNTFTACSVRHDRQEVAGLTFRHWWIVVRRLRFCTRPIHRDER